MKELKLSQRGAKNKGKVALVDDDVFEDVSRYNWTATRNSKDGEIEKWYAQRKEPQKDGSIKTIYLHRYIMRAPAHLVVDHHPNPDGLCCLRSNMRLVTAEENTKHCRFKKRVRDNLPDF